MIFRKLFCRNKIPAVLHVRLSYPMRAGRTDSARCAIPGTWVAQAIQVITEKYWYTRKKWVVKKEINCEIPASFIHIAEKKVC